MYLAHPFRTSYLNDNANAVEAVAGFTPATFREERPCRPPNLVRHLARPSISIAIFFSPVSLTSSPFKITRRMQYSRVVYHRP